MGKNIAERIRDSQAVILFFTKGILLKENSYVRKEYKMATEFFNKKVYVIMLDSIKNEDVPYDKVPWWIDIQEKQNIHLSDIDDLSKTKTEILSALGIVTHEDKMNQIIMNYRILHDEGKLEEAELYLSEYLHGISLSGKAKCIANLYIQNPDAFSTNNPSSRFQKLDHPLINHMGDEVVSFDEGIRFSVDDNKFVVGNVFLFHRGSSGDAHIITIWRNENYIYTIGGLIDACGLDIYYDSLDGIIYLIYKSQKEEYLEGKLYSESYIGITTMENLSGDVVCNDFKYLSLKK